MQITIMTAKNAPMHTLIVVVGDRRQQMVLYMPVRLDIEYVVLYAMI